LREHEIPDRGPCSHRLLRELRGLRVAKVRTERRRHRGAAIEQFAAASLVGLNAVDGARAKDVHRVAKNRRRVQRVPRDHGHHDVELELTRFGRSGNRRVTAQHLKAHLVHHFRNRRIHFAGHDRRSRLYRRQGDLAQARTRAHAQQTQVARDLSELHGEPAHRARVREHVSHALCDAKWISGREDIEAGQRLDVLHCACRVVVPRVQTSTDRGRTEIELAQLIGGVHHIVGAPFEARGVTAEFLTERNRHRILQVGAPDFQHVLEGVRFVVERGRERACGIEEAAMGKQKRDAGRRGKHVVGRLSHVDVIVRMNEAILTAYPAHQLGGAVGQHLVRVHVVRGAGAGLIDVDDEVVAQRTAEDFVRRAGNRAADARVEAPERHVGLRRGLLDENRRGDEIGRRAQPADRKVLDRPRRLNAVVRLGGDGVLTQGIALHPHRPHFHILE
jgi:hypothetical protein